MENRPPEQSAAADGAEQAGFPNKRGSKEKTRTGHSPDHDKRARRSSGEGEQMLTDESDPSRAQQAPAARGDTGTDAPAGAMPDAALTATDEERLLDARAFHRLAAEGKLQYDYTTHTSE
eukprot:3129901-Rhodomonas_salina.1